MGAARERCGAVVTFAGVAAAAASVRHTGQHVRDDAYRLPEARHGAGHVQYHMAREALITTGALAAVAAGVLAGPGRGWPAWRAMAAVTAGHSAAMWSGGPVTGRWAPNRQALILHLLSTAGLIAGTALLLPGPRGDAQCRK